MPVAICHWRSLARNHWPTNLGRAQLYYSPGYPLLVSPAFVLADYPFLLLSLFNFALALLFIAGVYVWRGATFRPQPSLSRRWSWLMSMCSGFIGGR